MATCAVRWSAAEKMMTRNKVTSLLVTDDAGKLQGVIQIYDIKL